METWSFLVICCLSSSFIYAGKDTDEELAHYVKTPAKTDMPWTSNEIRINKMIEEEIIKFNYAPETTESPFDSQGKPRPTESRNPIWWNAYRQEKDGDRPDWSAEIRDLLRNPRTSPPWTPSQESEPCLSKWKDISPFTWKPGVKISWTRRTTTTPDPNAEPTTERSFSLQSAVWDPSTEEGEGTKQPPLDLSPLQKGYKKDDEYLKVKPRKKQRKIHMKKHDSLEQIPEQKLTLAKENKEEKSDIKSLKLSDADKQQREIQLRRDQARRKQNSMIHNFARIR